MSNINSLRKLSETNKTNVKRGNAYRIDPRIIKIRPGHNPRGAFTENYWETEAALAHIENFRQAYTNGDFIPPIVVQVTDGIPYVQDGEHRLRGALAAIEAGTPILTVDVVESSGDELQQTLTLLKGNEGKPWSPVERAVIYGRFRSYGMSVEQIAAQVGKTVQHVYEQLNILDMPLELKRRIQNGEISASAAIKQFKNPSQTIVKRPPAKLIRSAVEAIRGEWSVTRQEGGKVLVELTAEQFEALKALKEHQCE
ncbi:ParB-like partition protein [Salmonella phage 9NA]|uniref:ParB/Spo0J HTH domain-containing protein n=1 Tax=Salmonella phage 9NA TaxID=1113547 RepID=A0A060D5B2_9CAUD|nr:ParB-like partition protein [Salmonella phage 9NA]AIB07084.1 hypothetical protein 9NA_081 [Salmonella phage 9NA]EDV3612605.1 hypothetical protein [Salmonella enterica subsp. enterica serovar 4,[5],12:i:-]